jgi:hypothetical protein
LIRGVRLPLGDIILRNIVLSITVFSAPRHNCDLQHHWLKPPAQVPDSQVVKAVAVAVVLFY